MLWEEGYRTESISRVMYQAQALLESDAVLAMGIKIADPDAPRVILNMRVSVHPELALNMRTALEGSLIGAGGGLSGHSGLQVEWQGESPDERSTRRETGEVLEIPLRSSEENSHHAFWMWLKPGRTFDEPARSFVDRFTLVVSGMLAGLQKIRDVSRHDPLTGLFNRRGIQHELNRIWNYLDRYGGALSILSLDVDHFKLINDSFGHAVGDDVLRDISQRLSTCVRTTDCVGRLGGDEIIILLPRATLTQAEALAQRILDEVRKTPFLTIAQSIHATVSIGLSTCVPREDRVDSETLLRQADQSLYMAKAEGRDRLRSWKGSGSEAMTSSRAADATDPLESRAEKNGWKGRILVVDDETGICRVLQGFLGREGHEVVTEQSATAARARIREAKPAFNLALIDVNLDGESGLDLVNDLERMDEAMVKIVMTGQATMENAIASLRAGAYDFIEKPFNLDHLSSSVQRALEYHALIKENRNYQHQLESMVRARNRELSTALTQLKESHAFTLNALSALLDAKEAATGEHSYRVSKMSRLLAQRMGLPQKLVDEIEHGGLLHDIGKVGVPDAILLKPGQLTEEEWTVMRQHPEIGYRILARRPHLAEIAQIVYQHQERYDGSGYPLGLKGEEICLGARIFAIVDTYDAIRSERPYSPSRPADVAVKVIQEGSGLFFDPKVVEVFETCWNEFEEIGKWSNPPAGCGTTP